MGTKSRPGWLEPQGPSEDGEDQGSLGQKLIWFAGIALASVLVVAITAYTLRGLLFL